MPDGQAKVSDARIMRFVAAIVMALTAGLVVVGGSAGLALRAFHIASGS